VGRLKQNGQLTGYSPLSRLEELERQRLDAAGEALVGDAPQPTPDGSPVEN
jgi:hypothetical protein